MPVNADWRCWSRLFAHRRYLAAKIKAFEVENPWLTDYSVFMAVKEAEGGKPWWQWSDRHAHYHTCIQNIFSYESRAAFWKFVQYIFYLQWGNIKAYANEKAWLSWEICPFM